MKKFIILLCALLPLSLNAQKLGNHHIEIGTGVAFPGEFLFETAAKESNTVNLYGEYRYNFTPAFSAGAVYSFVIPHKGDLSYTDKETKELVSISETTNYHTLNAIAEYKLGPYGPMCFFVGAGAGAQYRYVKYSHSLYPAGYWSADVSIHAGLEFFEHLRLTLGHYHDLHYPISALSSGAPYYYINLGWSF